MQIKSYTGGMAETNGYLVGLDKENWLAIDAPEGFLDFIEQENASIQSLVLTHGHWDHIWDAAAIAKKFDCPVLYHQDDEVLCTHPQLMMRFGLNTRLQPIQASSFLEEGENYARSPWNFQIFHIPGHCPGSICLYEVKAGVVFVGDVLFYDAVGRWDLPGGSRDQLLQGIREKLFALPDDTVVYPGHGPTTTIGREKRENPYAHL